MTLQTQFKISTFDYNVPLSLFNVTSLQLHGNPFSRFSAEKINTIQLLLFNIKIIRMCLVILGTCLQFHTPERDNSLSNPCQLIHLLHRGQRKRKIEKILKALHLPQTESNLSFINRFLDDTKHA